MSENNISIASSHYPQVSAGRYKINVKSENEISPGSSSIDFIVSGFMYNLPQTEILSVYPPKDAEGNYAGSFPFVQFRRSSLPWDFDVKDKNDRIPYLFLALFEENEIDIEPHDNNTSKVLVKRSNTSNLEPCYETDKEFTYLTVPLMFKSQLPTLDEIKHLAHVRIQEDTSNNVLDFPKETSIVLSKKMVFPNKKYYAFVCSYIINSNNKFKLANEQTSDLIVLSQWQFASLSHNSYQYNELKFEGVSLIDDIKKKKSKNPVLNGEKALIEFLEKYNSRFKSLIQEMNSDEDKKAEILSLLKYEGKTLKGMLQELIFSEIKYTASSSINNASVNDLIDLGKVPLLHYLKSGGKLVSWYQGPFVRNNHQTIFKGFGDNLDEGIDFGENIPNFSEKLIFYSNDTQMIDLGYAAAWQLGRLLVMNNAKVLQEIKKWKHQLKLNELIASQNEEYSPINLSVDNSVRQLPDLIKNFVINMVKFVDFPYYYLFPHESILPDESIKYFKLDNSWVLSMLFGVFSVGNDFKIKDFRSYVLNNSDVNALFNYKEIYTGFVISSEIIVNWPQLEIEIDDHSAYKYITDLAPTVRLYLSTVPFSRMTLFMKNENAHFAIDFPNNYTPETITQTDGILNFAKEKEDVKYSVSGFENNSLKSRMPFDLLCKQPKVIFNIKN